MTSIKLKIEESWYASMDCKVQKSGPWVCFYVVCFYVGHSTGYKLGNHPKNIEPCAHRARTVRRRPLGLVTPQQAFAPAIQKAMLRALAMQHWDISLRERLTLLELWILPLLRLLARVVFPD